MLNNMEVIMFISFQQASSVNLCIDDLNWSTNKCGQLRQRPTFRRSARIARSVIGNRVTAWAKSTTKANLLCYCIGNYWMQISVSTTLSHQMAWWEINRERFPWLGCVFWEHRHFQESKHLQERYVWLITKRQTAVLVCPWFYLHRKNGQVAACENIPGSGHLLHGPGRLPQLRDDPRVEEDHQQGRHGEQHQELVDGEPEAHRLLVLAVVYRHLGEVVAESHRLNVLHRGDRQMTCR